MKLREITYKVQQFLSEGLNEGIAWSVASLIVMALSGIFMNIVIILLRGEEALGVFNQVYALYFFASQIGVASLQLSVLKDVSRYASEKNSISEITGAALVLVFFFATSIALILWQVTPSIGIFLQSQDVALGMRAVLPGLVFFCLNKILINVINGLEKMKAYAIFRSIRYLMIPIFILILILLEINSAFLASAFTLSELFLFFTLIIFLFPKHISINFFKIPTVRYLEHLRFSARGFFSGILVQLNTKIDIILLGFFLNDYAVGVYSFAATIAEGFRQLSIAIRWNIDPQLASAIDDNNPSKIETLAHNIRKTYFPIIIILGLIGIFIYPLAINIVSGGPNWPSVIVFVVIMVGVLLGTWYRPFSGILIQGGRPGISSLYVLILLIGDIMLNLIFIPLVGIYGAAIVTMVTYILEGIYLQILAKKIFGVNI